jgi:hypothetical protein
VIGACGSIRIDARLVPGPFDPILQRASLIGRLAQKVKRFRTDQ